MQFFFQIIPEGRNDISFFFNLHLGNLLRSRNVVNEKKMEGQNKRVRGSQEELLSLELWCDIGKWIHCYFDWVTLFRRTFGFIRRNISSGPEDGTSHLQWLQRVWGIQIESNKPLCLKSLDYFDRYASCYHQIREQQLRCTPQADLYHLFPAFLEPVMLSFFRQLSRECVETKGNGAWPSSSQDQAAPLSMGILFRFLKAKLITWKRLWSVSLVTSQVPDALLIQVTWCLGQWLKKEMSPTTCRQLFFQSVFEIFRLHLRRPIVMSNTPVEWICQRLSFLKSKVPPLQLKHWSHNEMIQWVLLITHPRAEPYLVKWVIEQGFLPQCSLQNLRVIGEESVFLRLLRRLVILPIRHPLSSSAHCLGVFVQFIEMSTVLLTHHLDPSQMYVMDSRPLQMFLVCHLLMQKQQQQPDRMIRLSLFSPEAIEEFLHQITRWNFQLEKHLTTGEIFTSTLPRMLKPKLPPLHLFDPMILNLKKSIWQNLILELIRVWVQAGPRGFVPFAHLCFLMRRNWMVKGCECSQVFNPPLFFRTMIKTTLYRAQKSGQIDWLNFLMKLDLGKFLPAMEEGWTAEQTASLLSWMNQKGHLSDLIAVETTTELPAMIPYRNSSGLCWWVKFAFSKRNNPRVAWNLLFRANQDQTIWHPVPERSINSGSCLLCTLLRNGERPGLQYHLPTILWVLENSERLLEKLRLRFPHDERWLTLKHLSLHCQSLSLMIALFQAPDEVTNLLMRHSAMTWDRVKLMALRERFAYLSENTKRPWPLWRLRHWLHCNLVSQDVTRQDTISPPCLLSDHPFLSKDKRTAWHHRLTGDLKSRLIQLSRPLINS